MTGIRSRRSSSTSRKPAVVRRAQRAPLPSSTAFEATVVAWTTLVTLRRRRPGLVEQLEDALDDAAGVVVRRRQHLLRPQRAVGAEQDDVRERAADVDADPVARSATVDSSARRCRTAGARGRGRRRRRRRRPGSPSSSRFSTRTRRARARGTARRAGARRSGIGCVGDRRRGRRPGRGGSAPRPRPASPAGRRARPSRRAGRRG